MQQTRTDNNYIVTGIPRSGTSLFSVILNGFENVVCLNEVLYNTHDLKAAYTSVREQIYRTKTYPNKFNANGELTTDTMRSTTGNNIQWRPLNKPVTKDFILGSKVNVPYLVFLGQFISMGFKIIAVVRHPLYTILSWMNTLGTNEYNIPHDERFRNIRFSDIDDKELCNIEVWKVYANLILQHEHNIHIFKYEDLIDNPEETVNSLSGILKAEFTGEMPDIADKNIRSRFTAAPRLDDLIKKGLHHYMVKFKYSDV